MPALDFDPTLPMQAALGFLHFFAEGMLRPAAAEFDKKEHEKPLAIAKQVNDLMRSGMGSGLQRHRYDADGADAPSGKGGGEGMGVSLKAVPSILFAEEIAWGSAALMLSFPGPGLAGAAIAAAGTPEQKKKWLARYGDGSVRWGAMAYTEPSCGSDTGAIKTIAKREGNSWILTGTKIFCTNGASADVVVVWATLDPSKGKEAIRAFVVEKDTPGFKIGHLEKKLGIRSSETAELILEDCKIPLENILGEYDPAAGPGGNPSTKGFKGAMATFDMTRPGVAAMAVGIARAALEYLQAQLKAEGWEGPAYGRARTNLSAVDDWMIEMETQIEAARLLARRAAFLLDAKQPNALEASMAKAKAGTVVVQVCAKAIELLGPEGLTRKHPVEMWLRDSKVYDIFEGTGQVNRLVVARRVLGYTSKDLQ